MFIAELIITNPDIQTKYIIEILYYKKCLHLHIYLTDIIRGYSILARNKIITRCEIETYFNSIEYTP